MLEHRTLIYIAIGLLTISFYMLTRVLFVGQNGVSSPWIVNFETQLMFIGPQFLNQSNRKNATLKDIIDEQSKLLQTDMLRSVSLKIDDVESRDQPMNFRVNGFEFFDFRHHTEFMSFLWNPLLYYHPWKEAQIYTEHAYRIVKEWASSDAQLRDLDVYCMQPPQFRNSWKSSAQVRPLELVHIDFPADEYLRTHFLNTLKKCDLATVFPKTNRRTLRNLTTRFHTAVNIWIPRDRILSNPLVLMDLTSFNANDTVKIRNQRFNVVGVKYHPTQKWYWKRDMKLGDAIIFNSLKTPHVSAKLPSLVNLLPRRSAEVRCVLAEQEQRIPYV